MSLDRPASACTPRGNEKAAPTASEGLASTTSVHTPAPLGAAEARPGAAAAAVCSGAQPPCLAAGAARRSSRVLERTTQ
jgi:hypothetical protein